MRSILRTAVLASLALSVPMVGSASSHREAPAITGAPKTDGTDFYMFNSYEPGRDGYVTILANYLPIQSPYGGPNYFALDPNAIYEIHIDNDGDAKEDITFQFKFSQMLGGTNGAGVALPIGSASAVAIPLKAAGPITAADQSALNFKETYTVNVIRGPRRTGTSSAVTNNANSAASFTKPYDNVGTKTFPNYAAYANQYINNATIPGCGMPAKVFVGQRAEGFAVNLGPIFDLVAIVPFPPNTLFQGSPGITNSNTNNILRFANVTTIALEVHKSCLVGNGNGVIGGWTTASLKQARLLNPTATFAKPEVPGGAYVQVSRLSNPLVNEVVIGLPDKDKFNSSEPKDDAQFATYVTNPTLPALLDVLFKKTVNDLIDPNTPTFATLAPTKFPRTDLVTAFLTGFKVTVPGTPATVINLNQLATVTPSEMIRLNTGIAATPMASQNTFGVAGGDLAGFPNGRRPGDDVVDIALRVVMGRLCHPLTAPVGPGGTMVAVDVNPGCGPADAPTGTVPFIDGAPVSAADFDNAFPYLKAPIPGAP